MPDLLAGAAGERQELGPYFTDIDRRYWQTREPGFWKLERQQHFREPGYDSWEAFYTGQWEKSLALLDAERDRLRDHHRRAAAAGFATHRVRVVQEPLTPYLQWELHALKIRDECGGPIRILDVGAVAEFEDDGLLPEIYTLAPRRCMRPSTTTAGPWHARCATPTRTWSLAASSSSRLSTRLANRSAPSSPGR